MRKCRYFTNVTIKTGHIKKNWQCWMSLPYACLAAGFVGYIYHSSQRILAYVAASINLPMQRGHRSFTYCSKIKMLMPKLSERIQTQVKL